MRMNVTLLGLTCALLAACAAEQEPEPVRTALPASTPVQATAGAEEKFDLTIVELQGQQAPKVTRRKLKKSEQEKMKAQRAAKEAAGAASGEVSAAIYVDPDCNPNSLWIYDGLNRTGNKACIAGAGTMDLSTLCAQWSYFYDRNGIPIGEYCSKYWFSGTSTSNIRSYWPGIEAGSLLQRPVGLCSETCRNWPAWGAAVDSVNCGALGKWVELSTWGTACWLSSSAYSFYNEDPAYDRWDWTDQQQGIAHSDTYYYLTQTETIRRFPRNLSLARDLNSYTRILTGHNHYGDPDFYLGQLFVPLEGSPGPGVGVLNEDLTALYGWMPIPGAVDAAWVAFNPQDGLLYTSDFGDHSVGGTTTLRAYVYYRSTLRLVQVKTITLKANDGSTKPLYRIQGGAFSRNGHLYLVSDNRANSAQGGIYGVDVVSGHVHVHIPFEYHPEHTAYDELEGITIDDAPGSYYGGQLHLMMIKAQWPLNDYIYFKHFRISDVSKL